MATVAFVRSLYRRLSLAKIDAVVSARLETGTLQTSAIALYEGCGFRACGAFGHYAELEWHRIAASLFYEKQL